MDTRSCFVCPLSIFNSKLWSNHSHTYRLFLDCFEKHIRRTYFPPTIWQHFNIHIQGRKGLNTFMFALNGDTLLYYFPLLLVLVTFELSLSVYKSSDSQWTTKLAAGNFFVNLLWIALLLSIVFNPNLFTPEFVPYMVEIYDSTAEKITLIINLSKTAIVLAVIVTNSIDVHNAFNNIGVKEET